MESQGPSLDAVKGPVSMLSQSGIIFAAYIAAGRVGAIAACLFLGISPWETLIVAVLIDMAQVPVYGLALETSKKHMVLPRRFQNWVNKNLIFISIYIHST